jgi:hypothetical protein
MLAAAVRGCVAAAVLAAAAGVWMSTMLPSGSRIQLRLTSSVSSANARVGDAVGAVVTVDVPLAGGVLPRGTVVRGTVRQVSPFSWAAPQALLWIEFQELLAPGGRTIPIATRLVAVDNARDTIDATGKILGIAPPREAPTSAEDSVSLAAVAPELYDLQRVAFRIRELERPEIAYPAGTDITVETVTDTPDVPVGDARVEPSPDKSLIALAVAQPTRTAAGRPPRPADVVNFVFNGSDEELSAAFEAAGWTSAVALSLRADARTVLAVAEDRGYTLGPVSLETMGGRPPDRVFQKQTNTFDRRHHVRIWRLAEAHQGVPVWIASATHDVGVKFVRQERTFTHRVETDIDSERQKIVDDLRFAGAIARYTLAERRDVPSRVMNATEDPMTTDGRIAVIVLQGVK